MGMEFGTMAFHCSLSGSKAKGRGVLRGGINSSIRPARLAIWLASLSEAAETETVLVYIIVVEPKMSFLNPQALKNDLKDKKEK